MYFEIICKCRQLFFLLIVIAPAIAFTQRSGTIKGKVIDQSTKQPMEAATIILSGKGQATTTDSAGLFIMTDLDAGNYSLIISYKGFQQKMISDITVANNKTFYLEAELLPDASSLDTVTVRKFRGENNPLFPVSSYSFSREEIFRTPGAQGDIFRAIGILPGVVSSGGQYSAIAVRGQGTSDNVYMADDIPIFQVSHLEIEGFNSGFNDPNGGRFSIFAPRVIDNANFQAGGFGAQYGRKSSSWLGLGIKEGNMETPFLSGQFDLLGFTLIYDGPSGIDKKTRVFASARYQNFYLLEQLINYKSAGTPSYGDYMIKTTTDINSKNKLSFIAMFNPELYKRTVEDVAHASNLNDDNGSNFVGQSKTSKAVIGLNLRTLTGKSSYWKNILYWRSLTVDNDLGNASPLVDGEGNIISKTDIPYENDLRKIKNDQSEFGYRSIFSKHEKNISMNVGFDVARVNLDYSRTLKHEDTLYSFGPNDLRPDPSKYYLTLLPADFNSSFNNFAWNGSAYIDLSLTLFKRLTLNPCIRYDYTGFTKENLLSPRILGSLALDEKQSVNFATGVYYQDPEYSDIASQQPGHRLESPRTIQYIFGYKIYFSSDLKLVAEGWYKNFDRQMVRPYSGQPLLNNNGDGHAYGADISLTKRLSDQFYGQVSYSYMQSKRNDHDGLGQYKYTFEEPHVVSLLASFNPDKKWIFSGKFRYATGRPSDRYVVHEDVFNNPSYLRYSQEIIEKNGQRLAGFISLDLRADYKVQRKKAAWTVFVDIVDVLNRFNQNAAIFQPLTGKEYFLGLAIFPTFGLRVDL